MTLATWLLAACSSYPAPAVPKSAPTDLQQTAAWDSYQRGAEATKAANDAEVQAIARSMMMTDQAATAQASLVAITIAAQQTADARYATETAVARATETAVAAMQATETAAANATETAVAAMQATETAAANATATQQSANTTATPAAATAIALELTATRQFRDQQRDDTLEPLRAWGPWVLGIAGLVLLAALGTWVIIKVLKAWDARQRVVTTGPYNRPLFLVDGPNGRRIIVDPSRMFGPAAVVDPNVVDGEIVTAPSMAPNDEYQNQATARAQAIEMQQAAHPPYPQTMVRAPRRAVPRRPQLSMAAQQLPGLLGVVPVNDLSEAAQRGILPPRLAGAIDAQWREVKEDDNE